MLKVRNRRLEPAALAQLKTWQAELNRIRSYLKRVAEGKRRFEQRNRSKNKVFSVVRATLRDMTRGPNRCMYCEDSSAHQIDHFRPKDFYPAAVFAWSNYIWSCGQCNNRKGNAFSTIRNGDSPILRVLAPTVKSPTGKPALLNPRAENPLESMQLDLQGTFHFVPTADPGTLECRRVQQTVEVLGLNNRDDLVRARRNAFGDYHARLEQYVARKVESASPARLKALRTSLQGLHHATVWEEMKRQRSFFPELQSLFAAAPEALRW